MMIRICQCLGLAVALSILVQAGPAQTAKKAPAKKAPGKSEGDPVGAGSALTAKEAEDLLGFHNKVRKDVGVEPLKWSSTLSKFAQEWADRLAETGEIKHRPDKKGEPNYGENIAVGSNVLSAAELWYGEFKLYKPGSPIPKDFAGFRSGHYTQIVWRKTGEIGAGKAVMKQGRWKDMVVLVCNYNPPGNFPGEKPY